MNILDLFSGTGGFSLGLQSVGFTPKAFCEVDGEAIKVLRKHWPNLPIFGDVTKLTSKELCNLNIDAITGGFPCTDISIAGKGEGIVAGNRSGLWFEYKRIINEVKPKYAIIENVSALLGRGLNTILQDLAEIGYDAAWTCLDSQYCGLPQRRNRVYILAFRDGIAKGADPLGFAGRSTDECKQQIQSFRESRERAAKQVFQSESGFSYYTRQRTDQYQELGVASTILKRDYKDYTDLVVQGGVVRKITPQERLLLQGYPIDYLDGLGLSTSAQYRMSGMSVPVVSMLGRALMRYDNEYSK